MIFPPRRTSFNMHIAPTPTCIFRIILALPFIRHAESDLPIGHASLVRLSRVMILARPVKIRK